MSRSKHAIYLLSFGILSLLCFLLPTSVSAKTERTVIRIINASSPNIVPDVGDSVYQSESEKPIFNMNYGSPAYFYNSGPNGYWQRYDGDTNQWFDATGTFTDDIYRYVTQVRIDGADGKNYVLSDKCDIFVDTGHWVQEGETVISKSESNPYSYITVSSSPICPLSHYTVTINDEGDNIDWSTSGTYDYGDVVILNHGTKEGMEFDHWSVDKGNVKLKDPYNPDHESFAMPSTDVVITAHWRKIVTTTEECFPDENFRNFVAALPQADDGLLYQKELETITSMDCSGLGISDLTGIKYFTALTSLDCSNNELDGLSLKGNSKLKKVNCSDNNMIWINLAHTLLEELYCDNNTLLSLNLSSQTDLTHLSCNNNTLACLEFPGGSKNYANFSCENNRVTCEDDIPLDSLHGLDINRVFDIQGGSFDNDVVTFDKNSNVITYGYMANPDVSYYFRLDKIHSPGWFQDGNDFKFIHSNGGYTENAWEMVGDSWYYFGDEGWMARGWLNEGGYWYFLDHNGHITTGWLDNGGHWYFFDGSGHMVNGWLNNGGHWYFFDGSGHMVNGWLNNGGHWYFFDGSGHMVNGWLDNNGYWYFFDGSGHMANGWLDNGGHWYFFDGSGHMVTGWNVIAGKWYYFNASGHMVTGWLQLGSDWFYMEPDGSMVTGWKLIDQIWYNFDSSGHMI